MDRSELIAKCRYYKGEQEPPKGVSAGFWFYEQHWVEAMLKNPHGFVNELSEYRTYGLENFETHDGTPISLKAVLCNRYFQGLMWGDPEGFKKWYKTRYIKER